MSFAFALLLPVVLAQPEIFSRFALDDGEIGASTLIDSVGPLTAAVAGISFVGGVARSGPDPASISLDWSSQVGFESGSYVSVWLRFVGLGTSLSETRLLTSQTVNITAAFDAADNDASFVAGSVVSGVATLPVRGIGATWRRLTIGYCGRVYYLRVYRFGASGVADEMPQAATSTIPVPSSVVLGGLFFPQQLEFKDVVLFRPRNVTDVMTPAWDEQAARQYSPSVVASTVTAPPATTMLVTVGTTMMAATTTAMATATKSAPTSVPTLTQIGTSAPLVTASATTSIASVATTSSAAPLTNGPKSDDDSVLVGGAVGGGCALVLIAIVVLAIVVWHRRRRQSVASAAVDHDVVPPPAVQRHSEQERGDGAYGVLPTAAERGGQGAYALGNIPRVGGAAAAVVGTEYATNVL